MRNAIIAAILLLGLAASAQTMRTLPTSGNVQETPACGTSPCLNINTTSTVVLNASSGRYQCMLQNTGLTTLMCTHGSLTSSSTRHDFILQAASTASAGDGAGFSCNAGPGVYRGAISCTSYSTSTNSSLDVSAWGY